MESKQSKCSVMENLPFFADDNFLKQKRDCYLLSCKSSPNETHVKIHIPVPSSGSPDCTLSHLNNKLITVSK